MNPIRIEVRLPDDQLAALAKLIAAEMATTKRDDKPFTAAELAKELGVCETTIIRRVKAGLIHSIPNIGKIRIPASELKRLTSTSPPKEKAARSG